MTKPGLAALQAEIAVLEPVRVVGRVSAVEGNLLRVSGLAGQARLGDQVRVYRRGGAPLSGEVLQMDHEAAVVLPEDVAQGVALGDRTSLSGPASIAPDNSWVGRIIDPYGRALDGGALIRGAQSRNLQSAPPAPAQRRGLGEKLETGMAVFNTLLPIVRGQRVGLFAGSGVGKSNLLGHLGRHMDADIVVFALIGERGRELRHFVESVLGPAGMQRSIVVAATSDQSPLVRRRCALAAMAVAEHFRDQGAQVLFLADSVTRFAEAHREVATASGELPTLRGFPASTAHMIMSLCERAGPGEAGQGDITALLSVLVAGSDMEEPIADILRGVLDGHVVLDRTIAERGRYPAIDLLRSVSRSLPDAVSAPQNDMISQARGLLGAYARSETMIKAGLYANGSDVQLDQAMKVWPELDAFIAEVETGTSQDSFNKLALILRRAGASAPLPASKASADRGASSRQAPQLGRAPQSGMPAGLPTQTSRQNVSRRG